jgi:hypothetical protein
VSPAADAADSHDSRMLHRPSLCVSYHAIFAGARDSPRSLLKVEFFKEFQWLGAALAQRRAREITSSYE